MARSRNIKPSFFDNEELAELGVHCQLLYIGLWVLADREGRLEDRPKRIKVQIFPYYEIDADLCLSKLNSKNFITRYEISGDKYIQIPKFKIHQNPHPNEKPSIIPPVPDIIMKCHDNITSTNDFIGTTRADSLLLIPDIRNDDYPPPGEIVMPQKIPYEEIVSAYNVYCPSLRRVRDITDNRRKAMKARWNKHSSLEFFEELFKGVQANDFLTGQNEKNWMADFDWLMNEANMAKVVEGKYNDRTSFANQSQSNKNDFRAKIEQRRNRVDGK